MYRSITVSMFAFGGMFGGLLSGWLADRVGRRGTILYNNVLIIIAVALMTSAKYIGIYYLITAGRFLIGISAGNYYLLVKLMISCYHTSSYESFEFHL